MQGFKRVNSAETSAPLFSDCAGGSAAVGKTRKRHAIHLRVSGPVISLKAPNSFSDLAAGNQGGMPLAPLREKSGAAVARAPQGIAGS